MKKIVSVLITLGAAGIVISFMEFAALVGTGSRMGSRYSIPCLLISGAVLSAGLYLRKREKITDPVIRDLGLALGLVIAWNIISTIYSFVSGGI